MENSRFSLLASRFSLLASRFSLLASRFSLLVLLSISMFGCEQDDVIPSDSQMETLDQESMVENSKSSDSIYYEIATSSETYNLFQTKMEYVDIVQGAIDRGHHIDSLRSLAISVVNGTSASIEYDTILFQSQSAADDYYSSLDSSISLFFNQDTSVLQQIIDTVSTNQGEIKNINFFFDNFDDISNNSTSILAELGGVGSGTTVSATPPCGSWTNVSFTLVCAYVCSVSTVGVGTPFCGWGCWCWFCSDSWLGSYICAQ